MESVCLGVVWLELEYLCNKSSTPSTPQPARGNQVTSRNKSWICQQDVGLDRKGCLILTQNPIDGANELLWRKKGSGVSFEVRELRSENNEDRSNIV